jgi:hypothetical protein
MKTCTVCGTIKAVAAFEPQRRQCIDCRKAIMKTNRAKYYARTRESALANIKEWRKNNEERRRAVRKAEYEKNADIARQAARKYRQENKAKVNAWSRKHQLARTRRTPLWLSADDHWMIEQAYELAQLRSNLFGFEWQVDHVVPLQGKLVSGLHTPYNLQVIPARDNRSKSNRFAHS